MGNPKKAKGGAKKKKKSAPKAAALEEDTMGLDDSQVGCLPCSVLYAADPALKMESQVLFSRPCN